MIIIHKLLSKMLPIKYLFTNHVFNVYKHVLALNYLQGLICHKIQPTNQLTNLLYTLGD